MNEFAVEKTALPENIETLSVFSEEKLRGMNFPENKIFELLMALDEAITNIVMYAYEGEKGSIEIRIRPEDEFVAVELIDSGKAFDPTMQPEPNLEVPIEERRIGGMGIAIVKRFTEDIKYYRKNGKNHFIIKKRMR